MEVGLLKCHRSLLPNEIRQERLAVSFSVGQVLVGVKPWHGRERICKTTRAWRV